jgi:hypothetical protein
LSPGARVSAILLACEAAVSSLRSGYAKEFCGADEMRRGLISIAEADRRALLFLKIVHEIEQLPLVYLNIKTENIKTENVRQPIVLG